MNIIKENKNNIYFSILIIALISSIGVEPNALFNIINDFSLSQVSDYTIKKLFIDSVNLFRTFSPVLCLIFFFIYFLKNNDQLKNTISVTNFILFCYFFSSILGFLINFNFENIQQGFREIWLGTYLGLQSLGFVLVLFFLNSFTEENYKKYLKLIFVVIFLVYLVFAFFNIKLFLFDDPNLSLYAINYNVNGIAMEHAVPRSTGISRIFILMYIFSIVFLFNYNFQNKKLKIFFLSLLVLLIITLIILLNSRLSILFLMVVTLFCLIIYRKNFFFKIFILIIISIFTYVIISIFPSIKYKIYLDNQLNKIQTNCKININYENFDEDQLIELSRFGLFFKESDCQKIKEFIFLKEHNYVNEQESRKQYEQLKVEGYKGSFLDFLKSKIKIKPNIRKKDRKKKELSFKYNTRFLDPYQKSLVKEFKTTDQNDNLPETCPYYDHKINLVLTGRLCHWYIILKEVKFQFFGKGPAHDRKIAKWGASSGLIYAYVNSGLIGIIFYFYFLIRLIFFGTQFLIIKFNGSRNYNKNNTLNDIFLIILLFFTFRSFFEISFGYWGVDQLIFLSLFIYYEKFAYIKN